MADFCKISADEVKAMKDALENQDSASAVGKIQEYLTKKKNVPLNIAVTGESGSGKSSFINAFRGLGDEDPDSAQTGVVETTKEPKAYPHPDFPNVTLWDLPGIGTTTFKANRYLVDVKFERYDFFIIVASQRFRECNVELISEIKKMKKNFYFIRNQIDTDIRAEKRKRGFNERSVLEAIRQDCIKGLGQAKVADVFLISCHDLGLYDFNRLQHHIQEDLPNQKKHSLLLAVPAITMEILQKKKEALQANIWKVSLVSALGAAVPLPGLSVAVDLAILVSEIKIYYMAFNLDDKSLQKLAERSGVPVEELKAEIKFAPQIKFSEFGPKVVIQLLAACSAGLAAESTAEYLFSLIPFFGSAIAGTMSFVTTRYMLNKCLDGLATDANNVLMKALMALSTHAE